MQCFYEPYCYSWVLLLIPFVNTANICMKNINAFVIIFVCTSSHFTIYKNIYMSLYEGKTDIYRTFALSKYTL